MKIAYVDRRRYFVDERYPDNTISLQQLRREYALKLITTCTDIEDILDMESFDEFLQNRMQHNGGTLREISVVT
ncbi:MAG: hypothetical protein RSF40_01675 [Oscillospiraceae bacterium]